MITMYAERSTLQLKSCEDEGREDIDDIKGLVILNTSESNSNKIVEIF